MSESVEIPLKMEGKTLVEVFAREDREKLARWMIENGFATGHGDTLDQLLIELTWQINEFRSRANHT
jgi:hypothetical protein